MAFTFLHKLSSSFISINKPLPPFLSSSSPHHHLHLHLHLRLLPPLFKGGAFPVPRRRDVCSQTRSAREHLTIANDGGNGRDAGEAETPPVRGGSRRRRLLLYTKPGCCLCDELKQKLQTVFLMGGDGDMNLSDVHLEVRDITINSEWEKAFQYEIPVLARVKEDASEEILPRLSPRLGFAQLQKKLFAALS